MAILDVIRVILDSLLAFLIRIGLWIFVAALAPTWLSVLFLIAIILIPIFEIAADDIAAIYKPMSDLALTVATVLSVHQLLNCAHGDLCHSTRVECIHLIPGLSSSKGYRPVLRANYRAGAQRSRCVGP
jgi:hypothetical protein